MTKLLTDDEDEVMEVLRKSEEGFRSRNTRAVVRGGLTVFIPRWDILKFAQAVAQQRGLK